VGFDTLCLRGAKTEPFWPAVPGTQKAKKFHLQIDFPTLIEKKWHFATETHNIECCPFFIVF